MTQYGTVEVIEFNRGPNLLVDGTCSRSATDAAGPARQDGFMPVTMFETIPETTCEPTRPGGLAPELQTLLQQIDQLAGDAERNGLPFVATALRNLTTMAAAEHRVATTLCT